MWTTTRVSQRRVNTHENKMFRIIFGLVIDIKTDQYVESPVEKY